MDMWETKPVIKRARQWREGDEFPGVCKEVKGTAKAEVTYSYFVLTISGQKIYLKDGDFIEQVDPKHYDVHSAELWLRDHQLSKAQE